MKRIIIVFLLSGSCNYSNNKPYFDSELLKEVSRLSSVVPPIEDISFTPIYIIGENDSISESRIMNLKAVYVEKYFKNYSEFSDFLFAALNQNIKLNTKDSKEKLYYTNTFLCDSDISKLYRKQNLGGIIDKYCDSNDDYFILKKQFLTRNEISTISYYFFINNFIKVEDDFKAKITFKKIFSPR